MEFAHADFRPLVNPGEMSSYDPHNPNITISQKQPELATALYGSTKDDDAIPTNNIESNDQESDQVDGAETIVDITISGGNFIATLFYIWQSISDIFTFRFNNNGFESCSNNKTNNIMLRLKANKNNVIRYEFDPSVCFGDDGKIDDDIYMLASFHSEKLHKALRSCGKVNITFTMYANDARLYYIKSPGSQVVDHRGASLIDPKIGDTKKYKIVEYSTPPIVKILVSEFVTALNDVHRAQSVNVMFIPYPNGLYLAGIRAGDSKVHYNDFGKCEGDFENDSGIGDNMEVLSALSAKLRLNGHSVVSNQKTFSNPTLKIATKEEARAIIVPYSDLKSFSRLHTVCPESSIISFYYEPGKPLMLSCAVGTFATLDIYIRNSNDAMEV